MNQTIKLGKGNDGIVYKLEIKLEDKNNDVFPYIDIDLNPCEQYTELTISASMYEGGRDVGGGQCVSDIMYAFPEDLDIQRLCILWTCWHLNGMKSGTRKQIEAMLKHEQEHPEWRYDYSEACDILEEKGLLVDNDFSYGKYWLVQIIPDVIIDEITELVNKLQQGK